MPAEFPKIWPFNDWARATDASSLGLNGSKWTALVGQRTHLDMYRYALRASPLLRKANTTRFVDKVPGYRENLEAVLRRLGLRGGLGPAGARSCKRIWTQKWPKPERVTDS